jgi:hypothetical protein
MTPDGVYRIRRSAPVPAGVRPGPSGRQPRPAAVRSRRQQSRSRQGHVPDSGGERGCPSRGPRAPPNDERRGDAPRQVPGQAPLEGWGASGRVAPAVPGPVARSCRSVQSGCWWRARVWARVAVMASAQPVSVVAYAVGFPPAGQRHVGAFSRPCRGGRVQGVVGGGALGGVDGAGVAVVHIRTDVAGGQHDCGRPVWVLVVTVEFDSHAAAA